MKKVARSLVALLVLVGALLALPAPTRIFSSPAHAQLLPTPDPTDPIDELLNNDDDEGDPEGDDDGDVIPDPEPDVNEPDDDSSGPHDSRGDGVKDTKGKDEDNPVYTGTSHIGGSFSTEKLALIAAKLRALGLGDPEINKTVYRPFIIGGEAAWTDTWGAPRFGPGAIVRTHEGQDVFCRYGDPVLAPEAGVVTYSDGGLGGTTARVHTSSSSYYYLTHLSATNAAEIPAGSIVAPGDVVGFCGNTGNAITTPPHVHFGYYVDGEARNPMRKLVTWLRIAERRVLGHLGKHQRRAVRQSSTRTLERLFGDAVAPDLSDLDPADESLLTIGSVSPAAGAFAALGQALQEAYSQGTLSVAWLLGDSHLSAQLD